MMAATGAGKIRTVRFKSLKSFLFFIEALTNCLWFVSTQVAALEEERGMVAATVAATIDEPLGKGGELVIP